MLAVPLPLKSKNLQPSRRRLVLGQSIGLLDGLGQGTARAAARLPELDDEAIELITAIAHRAGSGDASNIAAAMSRHGHVLELGRLAANTWALIAQATDDIREVSRILLTTVAGLSAEDVELTGAQRWRLPELCDFFVLLGIDDVSIPAFRAVRHDSEPTRENWMRLMALSAGVDPARLATEARAAIDEAADTDDPDQEPAPFNMASAWPATNERELDFGRISVDDLPSVVGLLTAESEWIAESAAELLWDVDVPGLDEQVADTLTPELPPERRFLVAVLSYVLSSDQGASAQSLFETSDPALRRAAATVAKDPGDDRRLETLRSEALRDDDATVRIAAGAASLDEPGQPPPAYWSCQWCDERNDLAAEDCRACDWGTRPAAESAEATGR